MVNAAVAAGTDSRLRANAAQPSRLRLTFSDKAMFYGVFSLLRENQAMDVVAAAQAYNRKAVRLEWHQFCDPTLAFTEEGYDEMLSLWRDKAGARNMPTRNDMTARDLKNFLRNILLFERTQKNPSRYLWRLSGTRVTEVVGHHTGQLVDESVPPEHLERWSESFDMILASEQPWRFFGRVRIKGREYLHAEHLHLPLANDNGEPAYIMGLCRYKPLCAETDDLWENELASLPGGLL